MSVTLFLSGDVMTGRGIDQVMATPAQPTLYESWVKSATEYVHLAEARNGPIPRRVEPEYIWGDALEVLDTAGVDASIINLETSVTSHDDPWPGKGIHYRMHPDNIACITVAGIDCCVLANNHVLDWSHPGLTETLETLRQAGMMTAGAGSDEEEAKRPATIETGPPGRVAVVALGHPSSGIPTSWSAGPDRPGVALLSALSNDEVELITGSVASAAGPRAVIVASIHWGSNWGYRIPESHRRFAHALIDRAGVDVVHGHSSHHPLGIEIYQDRPILYGCGDLINDYEGISGHESYHPDLGILYLVTTDEEGGLEEMELVPMRMRRFRLEHPPVDEVAWMEETLRKQSEPLGAEVSSEGQGRILVRSLR
jgi:poly-gamma-glutamate synthesis protein (capsule biosynthesis protein)